MASSKQASPFPLRILEEIKAKARIQAEANRRSLNAEIGLLIEEGLMWREMQQKKQAAA